MVSSALIIETIVKWIIPFICVTIVGIITARLVNPIKKGNQQAEKEKWEELASHSSIARDIGCCKQKLGDIESESKAADTQILTALTNLNTSVTELNNKFEHQEKEIDVMREGLLDAHLQNLIETCKGYVERGWCTPLEFDHYNTRLEVYHKLGGNGHMDNWNQLMQKLPKWNEEEYKRQHSLK